LKVEIAPRNRLVTPRPSQSILASVHGELMPTLEDALSRFEAEANSGEALLRNTDSLYATEADVLA
jgi:hypothetical protein